MSERSVEPTASEPTPSEPTPPPASWQQRFEESVVGQRVLSVVVMVIVVAGVVWNLPASPIKSLLTPMLAPTAIVNLNRTWAVFAPDPPMRTDLVDVQVTMSDGSTRVWSSQPPTGVNGLLAASRWQRLLIEAVIDPSVRPGLARWVVREVTRPGEQAVRVAVVLRARNLPPPGQEGGRAVATKVLYEETLATPQ